MTIQQTQQQKDAWLQAIKDLREGKLTQEELIARHDEFGFEEKHVRGFLQRK
jgi:hypothetical protein